MFTRNASTTLEIAGMSFTVLHHRDIDLMNWYVVTPEGPVTHRGEARNVSWDVSEDEVREIIANSL